MVRVVKVPIPPPPEPPLLSPSSPPPVPPAPLSPGSRLVTVHKTVVQMTAAGDVSDYGTEVKAGLASKFAELAGVDPSAVTVEVTPASVLITVSIIVQNAAAATALASTVTERLGDASAASAFTGLTITSAPSVTAVTETILIEAVPPSGPPPTETTLLLTAMLPSLIVGFISIAFCLIIAREALKKSKAQRATRPNASKKEVASPVGVASPPFRQVV